jgi:hypothetical protein
MLAARHGMKGVEKEAKEEIVADVEATVMIAVEIMPGKTEEMVANSAEVVAVVVNPETNNLKN